MSDNVRRSLRSHRLHMVTPNILGEHPAIPVMVWAILMFTRPSPGSCTRSWAVRRRKRDRKRDRRRIRGPNGIRPGSRVHEILLQDQSRTSHEMSRMSIRVTSNFMITDISDIVRQTHAIASWNHETLTHMFRSQEVEMDIPQLQAELAAKADEAWPSTALNGPWTSPRHRRPDRWWGKVIAAMARCLMARRWKSMKCWSKGFGCWAIGIRCEKMWEVAL